VIADPEIEKVFPALQRVKVAIHTSEGRELTRQLDYPKGDPRNPLTDREVEEKFAALAEGVLSKAAQKKLKDAIWNLEKLGSVRKLMALTKSDRRAKKASATRGKAKPAGTKTKKARKALSRTTTSKKQ
jgi:2-methylcitrate dehydratase